ncbi:S-protein homolog 6-like [Herrania umbratica]|uniref:S-protein homolog n=1 Tax=Herrania umbratica TaxID=108875 RepID=A0A6J1AY83_9ROSI|nr:S-protein homolog 6-like [Herrania umbratica]
MRIPTIALIVLEFRLLWKKRLHHYLPNMKIATRVLIMFCVAVGIIFMSVYQPEHFFGMEYEVRVINGFSNNSSLPLVIWCISQQDGDMGGRALQEGDDFGWRLKTNIWGNSHYLCTLKWDAKRRSFDAFKVPRDSQRCAPLKKCSWLVKEDGFYFSSDEVNWKKDFSWY